MKKIILMFVVLITSIANAQTFNFDCTSAEVRTNRTDQLAALIGQHNVTSMTHFESDPGSTPAYVGASYVQNGSPLTFGLSTSVGLIEDITDWNTKYSELVAKLIADSGIEPTTHAHRAGVLTSYNSIDGISNIEVKVDNPTNLSVATVSIEWELNGVAQDTYYFSATNPTVDSNGQVPGDLSYYEPGQFETNRERLYNKLIAHIPVGPTFESELADLYGADTPPTELGTIINDAALAVEFGIAGNTPRKNFMESLAYFNVTVSGVFDSNSKPSEAHLSNGNVVPNIGTNDNTSSMSADAFSIFTFEVVKAFWHIGHPNYVDINTVEGAIIAMYNAANPPTSFVDVIGDAAITANQNSGTTTNKSRTDFMTLFDKYGLVFTGFGTANGANTAEYANNTDFPSVAIPNGNDVSDTNFKAWALEVAKAIWLYGHPNYVDYSALRAERIAEIAVLDDASVNVVITEVQVENFGEAFRISVLGDPNIIDDFATGIFETGVTLFERLGDTEWAEMKLRISNRINVIDADVNKRNARITILVDNSTTNVIVGARFDNVRGDLFEVDNGTTKVQIYANDYDLPLVADGYTRLEHLTDDEYSTLNNAIIQKVGDLDPANAIYGFSPSEFYAATLNEKVLKAYDIGKDNDDIQAVSGSLVIGLIHGSKITIRVKARNYPLDITAEMAHDADYEGWKTFIDRILYLVKTGDGSERTTRENHINGIAGNISVKDLDGGDDDWAVAWNDLPFIYGGSDVSDHNNSYDSHGNTSRVFAGYHQDNIGLLPGIIYEALLVEIDRINSYVIAADALRRHSDGGINKEREVGLKALTGDAAFHEDAAQEWFVLNSDVTVWTSSKYGPLCNVEAYLWLGVMDNFSFRYMYIIIRNELLRNADGTRYYNNVNQNIYCL